MNYNYYNQPCNCGSDLGSLDYGYEYTFDERQFEDGRFGPIAFPFFPSGQGQQPGPPMGPPPGQGWQQPGPPTGPPPGQGSQFGPPTAPPPSAPPVQSQQAQTFAVDPGSIRGCMFRYTYIWLRGNRDFWFYPTYIGRTSVAGYRWTGFRWVYSGLSLRQIQSFTCV
ncbi:hypothetical protein [Radiobacillus sp. PE A8.2]|uniref:hypothetical protein n=1 Tax=Radiobacillus sp. PE A8.2 TaxID=3380349 RepID=UPI00388F9875